MAFISRERYIDKMVAKLPPVQQAQVADYRTFAVNMGARICNDGYPDTRFKGTYRAEDTKARKYVARVRDSYEQQIAATIEQNSTKVVAREVALEIIAGLKSLVRGETL